MSLPNELKQVFFALLAGIVVVVSGLVPGVASASAATVAPVEGSGHIVITYACDGKIGLYIQGFNDVEGSDPISFVLTDNITNQVVANVTDVPYGTYRTSGIGLQFGDSYDITATGPGGYSELFQGTFNCAAETVTATPPVFTDKTGTADDTYTVPSKVGVEYSVGDVVKPAGTYPGTGTVTVTARAESGYVLEGTTTWTYTFTVTAANKIGTSPPSAPSNAVTPSAPLADPAVIIPLGAPRTGAGGASNSGDSPLTGLGGLALLLAGAAMVPAIRRRRV